MNKRNVGRPPALSTIVTRTIIQFAKTPSVDGHTKRDVSGAILAAGIIVLARNSTMRELASETPSVDNGVGFSRSTMRAGMACARWVNGESPKKFSWDRGPSWAKKKSGGVKSWAEVAWDIVNTHSKQLGRLEVANGAFSLALLDVEKAYGMAGLTAAFNKAVGVNKENAHPIYRTLPGFAAGVIPVAKAGRVMVELDVETAVAFETFMSQRKRAVSVPLYAHCL